MGLTPDLIFSSLANQKAELKKKKKKRKLHFFAKSKIKVTKKTFVTGYL
jgi:hypothetical protein